MAITEAYANNATISITEYSLPNNSSTLTPMTDVGVFQAFIDVSALTATELYRIKLYETLNGVKRVFQHADIAGAQVDPLYVTPPFSLINGWDMTLTKINGTDRVLAWSIRKAA